MQEKDISQNKLYKRIEDYKEEMCLLNPHFEWKVIKKVLETFFTCMHYVLTRRKLNIGYENRIDNFGFLIIQPYYNLKEVKENLRLYIWQKQEQLKQTNYLNSITPTKIKIVTSLHKKGLTIVEIEEKTNYLTKVITKIINEPEKCIQQRVNKRPTKRRNST